MPLLVLKALQYRSCVTPAELCVAEARLRVQNAACLARVGHSETLGTHRLCLYISTMDWSHVGFAGLACGCAIALLLWALLPKQFLSPDKFKRAKLIEKETVTHNTNRYRFSLPGSGVLGLPVGQHISFMYEDALGKPVMRSYTPVTGNETVGYVDFVIKVYPEGKMSQHIDQLSINDTILMRGPKGKFKYTANMKECIGASRARPCCCATQAGTLCCAQFVKLACNQSGQSVACCSVAVCEVGVASKIGQNATLL